MRSLFLLLLVFAVAAAPLAMVPTGVEPAPVQTAETEEGESEEEEKKPELPSKASWGELTPGHQPVPGPSPDEDEDDQERPELPPALYARRLKAAPTPPPPPTEPPRADLCAGHLSLPPPSA
ncbi:MAG: hypothetical protein ACYTHK_18750 [Planctomycetota bacterium]|jgi:hypothetical protein